MASYPLTYLTIVTVQDVSTLATFNPHGGPITHSSTGSKPDSPVHPRFPKLCLTRGLIYNSRATSREIINSGIRHNTYYRCSGPVSHFVSGIERLPTRSKHLMVLTYSTLDIVLSFHSRVTFRHHPRGYQPDSRPFRGPFFSQLPLVLHTYNEDSEERTTTSS